MLTTNQLIKYLRNHHNINVKKGQAQDLRNIGYYHGYKGYRFIRVPSNKINFTSLDEVIALNKFDMELKALFYPKIMFIENALKSYVIEAVLEDSKSEDIELIFKRSLTEYKSCESGSSNYRKQYLKRMILKEKINRALLRDYESGKQVVKHFFDFDRPMPIWAVFESLTLGEFINFFSCLNSKTKLLVSNIIGLPSNFDSDGKITEFMIYTIKDLRNAIAHNSPIFDARFRMNTINKRLICLLTSETRIKEIDFKYIYSYIILISYLLLKLNRSKQMCQNFVKSFIDITEKLRKSIPSNVCDQILGTGQKTHLLQLKDYISKFKVSCNNF